MRYPECAFLSCFLYNSILHLLLVMITLILPSVFSRSFIAVICLTPAGLVHIQRYFKLVHSHTTSVHLRILYLSVATGRVYQFDPSPLMLH